MQELQLKIRHIILVTGSRTDEISFSVPNDQALDKVLGDTESRECFPELHFDLNFPKGKGEDLLSALGLVADKIISREPHKYDFQGSNKGEQKDEGS